MDLLQFQLTKNLRWEKYTIESVIINQVLKTR